MPLVVIYVQEGKRIGFNQLKAKMGNKTSTESSPKREKESAVICIGIYAIQMYNRLLTAQDIFIFSRNKDHHFHYYKNVIHHQRLIQIPVLGNISSI